MLHHQPFHQPMVETFGFLQVARAEPGGGVLIENFDFPSRENAKF